MRWEGTSVQDPSAALLLRGAWAQCLLPLRAGRKDKKDTNAPCFTVSEGLSGRLEGEEKTQRADDIPQMLAVVRQEPDAHPGLAAP